MEIGEVSIRGKLQVETLNMKYFEIVYFGLTYFTLRSCHQCVSFIQYGKMKIYEYGKLIVKWTNFGIAEQKIEGEAHGVEVRR